jgi:predicted ATPase
VGLYRQRYSWVAPDMEISGLEDEYLLSAGLPRLIYLKLDNFEQAVDAALQGVERLEACPGRKVLVTSRTALRVRGEQELIVQPLPLPDRGAPAREPAARIETLTQSAAVVLFVRRVQEVRPDFALTAENGGGSRGDLPAARWPAAGD